MITSNYTSILQSVGFSKSKADLFRQIKSEKANKKHRFKKKKDDVILDLNSSNSQILLSNTSTELELSKIGPHHIPPEWVDIYDETQEKMKSIRNIYKETTKLIAARIQIQFGHSEDLNNQINKKNSQSTALLQECERNLNRIKRANIADESFKQRTIRENTQKLLATQIQEIATLLRKQQKGFLDRINGAGGGSDLDVKADEDTYNAALQDMIMAEDIAKERDEGVNKLIENINKLSHMFRDMNQLVIEQGTIVDRIDFNLENAVEVTVKAKKELVKADTAMNSPCGAYMVRILIIANIIFAIFLFLKFRSKSH